MFSKQIFHETMVYHEFEKIAECEYRKAANTVWGWQITHSVTIEKRDLVNVDDREQDDNLLVFTLTAQATQPGKVADRTIASYVKCLAEDFDTAELVESFVDDFDNMTFCSDPAEVGFVVQML